MNDDLNLLVTFLSHDDSLVKVAMCIEHGMNDAEWLEYEFFREPEIEAVYRKAMPMHVESFCKTILAVELIFDIKG
tara:strand:+ start:6443 stop:6670 length:228 start_codon:yes stop_codon:yes gene_type:complete